MTGAPLGIGGDRPGGVTPPEAYTPPPAPAAPPPPTPPIATQGAGGADPNQQRYEALLRLEATHQLPADHQAALDRIRAAGSAPTLPPFDTNSPIYGATAEKYRLQQYPGVLQALAHQESSHDPNVQGTPEMGGSVGLMQITQETGAPYGITPTNRTNPYMQVEIAGHILRDALDRNHGDLGLALKEWNPAPNFANTVIARMSDYGGPTQAPPTKAAPVKAAAPAKSAPPAAPGAQAAPQAGLPKPRPLPGAPAAPAPTVPQAPTRPQQALTTPQGPGLYSYKPADHQHGSPATANAVSWIAAEWAKRHPGMDVPIGDVNWPGHLSHREGRDVDIGIPRMDGQRGGGQTRYNDPSAINDALQQEFVDLIRSNPYARVEVIGFDNPRVNGVHEWRSKGYGDHGNHFHVRFTGGAPTGAAAGAAVGAAKPSDPSKGLLNRTVGAGQQFVSDFAGSFKERSGMTGDEDQAEIDWLRDPNAAEKSAKQQEEGFKRALNAPTAALGAAAEALTPENQYITPKHVGDVAEWAPVVIGGVTAGTKIAKIGGEVLGTKGGLARKLAKAEEVLAQKISTARGARTTEVQRAMDKVETARANVEASRTGLEGATTALEADKAGVGSAQRGVEAARSGVEAARTRAEASSITRAREKGDFAAQAGSDLAAHRAAVRANLQAQGYTAEQIAAAEGRLPGIAGEAVEAAKALPGRLLPEVKAAGKAAEFPKTSAVPGRAEALAEANIRTSPSTTAGELRATKVQGSPKGSLTEADVGAKTVAARNIEANKTRALDQVNELVNDLDKATDPRQQQAILEKAVGLLDEHFPGTKLPELDYLRKATKDADYFADLMKRHKTEEMALRTGRAAAKEAQAIDQELLRTKHAGEIVKQKGEIAAEKAKVRGAKAGVTTAKERVATTRARTVGPAKAQLKAATRQVGRAKVEAAATRGQPLPEFGAERGQVRRIKSLQRAGGTTPWRAAKFAGRQARRVALVGSALAGGALLHHVVSAFR